jgi:hypothetical protein
LTLLGLQIAAQANPAEPDRTRVMPNRHEGVFQESHILFTYVDERRKRRLTLDLYRPVKTKGKRPVIVMFFWRRLDERPPGPVRCFGASSDAAGLRLCGVAVSVEWRETISGSGKRLQGCHPLGSQKCQAV